MKQYNMDKAGCIKCGGITDEEKQASSILKLFGLLCLSAFLDICAAIGAGLLIAILFY